jgi:hypothetical protein
MSNAIALRPEQPVAVSMADIERMANAVAKSGLFGVKTPDQAMALMLIAHAEGMHPAIAARDYDIIQGKPAKKAEAMQRDFLKSGGRIKWKELSDTAAEAEFTHEAGGSVSIRWDMDRAGKAGLSGKDMWKKFPRQMLRARCISEGVRTVNPMATSGMYAVEEVQDFAPSPMQDVTPKPSAQEKLSKLAEEPAKPAEPVALYSFTDPDGVVSQVTGSEWLVQAEIQLNTASHPGEFWKDNEATFRQIHESAKKKGAAKAVATCGRVAELGTQALAGYEPGAEG